MKEAVELKYDIRILFELLDWSVTTSVILLGQLCSSYSEREQCDTADTAGYWTWYCGTGQCRSQSQCITDLVTLSHSHYHLFSLNSLTHIQHPTRHRHTEWPAPSEISVNIANILTCPSAISQETHSTIGQHKTVNGNHLV